MYNYYVWKMTENTRTHYLILCDIHYYKIHGKTVDSDPHIDGHYLVYDKYEPFTGKSLNMEYNSDEYYDMDEASDLTYGKMMLSILYRSRELRRLVEKNPHPSIKNFSNIVSKPDYIKPEIAEVFELRTGETIAVLKTFWLRIIQKTWKKICIKRKEIIKLRCRLSNLSFKERRGYWPEECATMPSIKGMLSNYIQGM